MLTCGFFVEKGVVTKKLFLINLFDFLERETKEYSIPCLEVQEVKTFVANNILKLPGVL